MIIISKRRLGLILSLILVSVCTFIIGSNTEREILDSVPTVALPVSNKVIVVDAGHGKPDERSRK